MGLSPQQMYRTVNEKYDRNNEYNLPSSIPCSNPLKHLFLYFRLPWTKNKNLITEILNKNIIHLRIQKIRFNNKSLYYQDHDNTL